LGANYQMLAVADPATSGELLEQRAIEPARRAEVGILDDRALPQSGVAQSSIEPLVLSAGRLAIEQQAEPVLAGDVVGRRGVLHLDERVGHRGQAEATQAIDQGMDQHGSPFQ
jgi:hypothetical protein